MLQVSSNNYPTPFAPAGFGRIYPLEDRHKKEVLDFLAVRPLHTFIKSSWIRDNGMASDLNRGTFYGYRDLQDQLKGVALIGHITLFEAQADAALAAFARLTKSCLSAHAVLGEAHKISRFMSHYTNGGALPQFVCRDLFMEKGNSEHLEHVPSLRPAGLEELEMVVPVHARMAFEESGVNPLDVDPGGFRARCARRIEQGRVWIAVENGALKFKADVVSDTTEAVYLEGVYVSAEHRGNGYGARCMTQLTNRLLEPGKSVCLLVNEKNKAAQACYRKAGYELRDYYKTVYLRRHEPSPERVT